MKKKFLVALLVLVMVIIRVTALTVFAAETAYTITVDNAINYGTVTSSVASASAGATVTLTVAPDDGYSLASGTLTVSDGTNELEITPGANDTYTFTMPAANVTVTARFGIPNGEVYYVNDKDNGVTTIFGSGTISASSWQNIIMPKVVVEEGITAIDANAFRGVVSLESITIPASVVSIGSNAFGNDYFLSDITYLGTSEPSVHATAFRGCDGLTSISVPADYTGTTFADIPVEKSSASTPAYAAKLTTADATAVVTYYETLEDAITAAKSAEGSTVMMLDNVQLSAALEIDGGSFIIDLNGKTLSNLNGNAIRLNNGANITVTSGIAGGKIESNSACVFVSRASAKVTGVALNITSLGVAATANDSNSVLILENVTVTSVYSAVSSANGGKVEILGNSSISGDYFDIACMTNSTLAIGEGVTFTDGLKAFEADNYKAIKDLLADGMAYWTGEKEMAILATDAYELSGAVSVKAECTHSGTSQLIYTAQGSAITAACADCSCPTGTLSLSIDPNDLTYDGTKKQVSMVNIIPGVASPNIIYTGDLTSAGTHTASATVGGATAILTFTIEKATPLIHIDASYLNKTYNLQKHTVTVDLPAGLDEQYVTVSYWKNGAPLPDAPTDAGTYEVLVSVKDSPNYEDYVASFDMTISPASVIVEIMEINPKFFYTGGAHTPAVIVTLNGGLPFDPTEYGGTVDYTNNIDVGIATATVSGNFTGSCSFEIEKATPTITVSAPVDKVMPGYVMEITGATDAIDNFLYPTTFTVVDGEGYSVDGNTITIDEGVKIGSIITVKMKSGETKNYLASEGTLTLEIGLPSVDTTELEKKIDELRTLIESNTASITDISEALSDVKSELALLDNSFVTHDELTNALVGIDEIIEKLNGETIPAIKNDVSKNASDIQTLDTTVKNLGAVVAGLPSTDVTDKLAADLNTLSSDLTNLKGRVEANEIEIAGIKIAIEKLNKLIEDGGAIEQINEELKKITDALNALDGTYVNHTELTAALDDIIGSIKDLNEKTIPEIQDEVSVNTTNISNLETSVDDIKQAIADLVREDSRLTSLVSTLDAELDALLISLDNLSGRVDKTEKDIASLQSELAVKYAELKALIDNNDNDIYSINDRLQGINDTLATLATVTDVQAEINILNSLIEDLTDRIKTNENNVSANINAISALQSTVRALQSTVASQNAALAQSISSLSSTLSILENRVEQNKQNISQLNTNLGKAVEELEKAIADGDKELSDKIESLTNALDDAKAALEKADEELVKKIETAEAALNEAIEAVQKNLDEAKAALNKAVADGDKALDEKIQNLNTALDNAITAYQAADLSLKTELLKKIESADATLDEAIKAVQKNLDDAQAALNKAVADGDTALDEKIETLNLALASAKAALEATDVANIAELNGQIAEAETALQAAVDALSNDLNTVKNELGDVKRELENKDNELRIFIIIVCVVSSVAFCGCATLAVFYFIDRKKKG